jgi:SAM-dependent methyltransferase
MDLCEITDNAARHPWEISRVRALRTILTGGVKIDHNTTVLDVGCGDSYAARSIFTGIPVKSIDGIDINLSDDRVKEQRNLSIPITIHNSFDGLKRNSFTLILLLDVIEHLDDDESFLKDIVDRYLCQAGYALITVPAFSALFSSHDRFMKHRRRYDRPEFIDLLDRAGLMCVSHGYLFASLLPIRLLVTAKERFVSSSKSPPKGVGGWDYPSFITGVIVSLLNAENTFVITLNKFGIRLPGLSLWALCKKRQS